MDQELKDSLDQIGRRLSGLSDEVQQAREENQQTRILLEQQHDDIRQLAEGMIGTNERLDSFRVEISIQFDQMKSFISLPYKDLDGRVKVLERTLGA